MPKANTVNSTTHNPLQWCSLDEVISLAQHQKTPVQWWVLKAAIGDLLWTVKEVVGEPIRDVEPEEVSDFSDLPEGKRFVVNAAGAVTFKAGTSALLVDTARCAWKDGVDKPANTAGRDLVLLINGRQYLVSGNDTDCFMQVSI